MTFVAPSLPRKAGPMPSPAKAALALAIGAALGTAVAIARVPGWRVRLWMGRAL